MDTRTWRIRIARAGSLAVLMLVVACTRTEDPRPNFVWIVWDTVRADHLSLYGYERETTPHLDRRAATGRARPRVRRPCSLPTH